MIRRRFWTGALKFEPVASTIVEPVDGNIAADELSEPCSADEEVFSRVSPGGTEADVLASAEAARESGTVRGCLVFDDEDEASKNLSSRLDDDEFISLSFEKADAQQHGIRYFLSNFSSILVKESRLSTS